MILLKSFYVDAGKGVDVLPITHEVRRVLKEGAASQGSVTIVVPSPGAGLAIMESEKTSEVKKSLEPFVSNRLIRCLLPKSLNLPVEGGRLSTDPWQEIFLIDYEPSARRREFRVQLSWEQKEDKSEGGAA